VSLTFADSVILLPNIIALDIVSLAVALSLAALAYTRPALAVSEALTVSLILPIKTIFPANVSLTTADSEMVASTGALAATLQESEATTKPPLPKPHTSEPQAPNPQPALEIIG
jgi:hypothetical protein